MSGLFCFDMQGTSMHGNKPRRARSGKPYCGVGVLLCCCAALLCYGVLRDAQRPKSIVRGGLQIDFGSSHYFVVSSTIVPKRAIFFLRAFLS